MRMFGAMEIRQWKTAICREALPGSVMTAKVTLKPFYRDVMLLFRSQPPGTSHRKRKQSQMSHSS